MTGVALGEEVAARLDAPSEDFLRLIPRDFARLHLLLSGGRLGEGERLIVAPATSAAAVINTGTRLGRAVETTVGDPEAIARDIDRAYADRACAADASNVRDDDGAAGAEGTRAEIDRLLERADRDLLSTQGKGPVVRLVDAVLFEALQRGASDVHVQPLADRALVRYRIDGVLHTMRELKPELANSVVSRVKVMGRMDIAERRVPQDGRATITIGRGGAGVVPAGDGARERLSSSSSRSIDLRISTLPTSYGERAVVRLLESSRGEYLGGFDALGMPGAVRSGYLERASRSSGIVLVTGPTGSGKTTTLYATLKWLASKTLAGAGMGSRPGLGDCGLNIVTIEDPIEYELSTVGLAISQAQVNTKKGVTFATGLRHILRQDPDVVMVGEVRDTETARIAIQASLTGHLVLSTLHTNDAASAVTRLVDLGVEPYLVSASLAGVLAQRLVRKVHAQCGGVGCSGERGCFGSGYQGRTGLFEFLAVNEAIRSLISRAAPASAIRAEASARGMRTLQEEGNRLIAAGITTEAEIARVVHGTGGDE